MAQSHFCFTHLPFTLLQAPKCSSKCEDQAPLEALGGSLMSSATGCGCPAQPVMLPSHSPSPLQRRKQAVPRAPPAPIVAPLALLPTPPGASAG